MDNEKKGVDKSRFEAWLDNNFEVPFFSLRYITLIPVLFALAATLVMFAIGAIETWEAVAEFLRAFRADDHACADASMKQCVVYVIRAIDAFLLGLVMLIFSYGVYDLFVSKLDPAARPGIRPNWLKFKDINGLKIILTQVVLIILIITFFELVVTHSDEFTGSESSVVWQFLVIPIGVVLIALGIGVFERMAPKE